MDMKRYLLLVLVLLVCEKCSSKVMESTNDIDELKQELKYLKSEVAWLKDDLNKEIQYQIQHLHGEVDQKLKSLQGQIINLNEMAIG